MTRGVAARRGLKLVDLGAELSPRGACFYDQWHFTVAGAQAAADLLAPTMASVLRSA